MLTNPKPPGSAPPALKFISTATVKPMRKSPIKFSNGVVYVLTNEPERPGTCQLCYRSSEHLTKWKATHSTWLTWLCRVCVDGRARRYR